MNIEPNQLPDTTDFTYKECIFGGDECIWFFPHLEGVKWTPKNLIFRSSIWRKSDWALISPGFKKFFNWSEKPNIYPAPDALTTNMNCVEKLDGSCLIISKYKGEWIVRTRRAIADTIPNGNEIEYFKEMFPLIFDDSKKCWTDDHSLIFEWITPSNQIVIKYSDPTIRLIGMVRHADYSYVPQRELDIWANKLGVSRPRYFKYKSMEQMMENVAQLKGEEGICVYYGNDQHIRKIKSDWYLSIHNFKNSMNLKNIVDLYFTLECPDYRGFCEGVVNQFDWEGFHMARPLISQICDGMIQVRNIIAGMKRFIEPLNILSTRKAVAEKIQSSYGQTSRADIVFTLYDKKPLNKNQLKKLLFQVLLD